MKGMHKFLKKIMRLTATLLLFANVPVRALAALEQVTPSGIAWEEIGNKMEEWAADNPDEYVSFAAAVFDDTDIVCQGAFGYADREKQYRSRCRHSI